MNKKRYTPEQIIGMLREAGLVLSRNGRPLFARTKSYPPTSIARASITN
jgi:hypothetical protein